MWDADMPQVREGAEGSDPGVDIMTFVEEEEIAPVSAFLKHPKKSPK
jgi:hypothetical protein